MKLWTCLSEKLSLMCTPIRGANIGPRLHQTQVTHQIVIWSSFEDYLSEFEMNSYLSIKMTPFLAKWPKAWAIECRVSWVAWAPECWVGIIAKCWVGSATECQDGQVAMYPSWIRWQSAQLTEYWADWVIESLSHPSSQVAEWKEILRSVFDIVSLKKIHPLRQCFEIMTNIYFL